ncbi:MAG: hypothetical protein U0531_08345 [Dehalococcoidia bacterium]
MAATASPYPGLLIGRTEHSALAAAARTVNDAMPAHALDLLERVLGGLADGGRWCSASAFRPGVKEHAHLRLPSTWRAVGRPRRRGAGP